MANARNTFSTRLLRWFDHSGRKDLPWQTRPTAYRVWVSEIMLQQTQVTTVIPYYLRFMQRFPDVHSLAQAAPDEVLHLWSGLGYYARARNLHRAARLIRDRHHGELPRDMALLQQLPGIGRSTAAAILALAHGERHAILDGNVKRVLARYHAIDGWPGSRRVEQQLWTCAESHTPPRRARDYTQAIMDLGATVCTRARPGCGRCPLSGSCAAHGIGRETDYPAPRPRKTLPVRGAVFLLLHNGRGETLLEQRPPGGVWGGLWSLPECSQASAAQIRRWCRNHLGFEVGTLKFWPGLRHTFSHFHLDITPVEGRVNKIAAAVMEPGRRVWYNMAKPDVRGLPAPVKDLLLQLAHKETHDTNGLLRKTRPRGRRAQGAAVSGRAG
ncbi:MAG: adenine DNA glycosylase [Gammaproteobacteria bacterium]|nr:MAG: adenine DNA glycosylase [Gammaproteobacteria bacterium]